MAVLVSGVIMLDIKKKKLLWKGNNEDSMGSGNCFSKDSRYIFLSRDADNRP